MHRQIVASNVTFKQYLQFCKDLSSVKYQTMQAVYTPDRNIILKPKPPEVWDDWGWNIDK